MLETILEFLMEIGEVFFAFAIAATFAIVSWGIVLFPAFVGLLLVLLAIFTVIYGVGFTKKSVKGLFSKLGNTKRAREKKKIKDEQEERRLYIEDFEARLDAVAERHPEKYTKDEWKEKYRQLDYAAFFPENTGRPHGPLMDERFMLEEVRMGKSLFTVAGRISHVNHGFSIQGDGFGGPALEMRFVEQFLEDYLNGYISRKDMATANPGYTVFETFDLDHPIFKRYNESRIFEMESAFAKSGNPTGLGFFRRMHEPFMEKKEREYQTKQEALRLKAKLARKEAIRTNLPFVNEKVTPFPPQSELNQVSKIKSPHQ